MKKISHVFREYDIRGYVANEITVDFAYRLGCAYAAFARINGVEGNIAVGYDCRLSSPGLAAEFSRGLLTNGYDVTLYGMGPTPQLYFAVFTQEHAGGIQITGSHNPPDMNGFKLMLQKKTLSGDAIQELKELFTDPTSSAAYDGKPGSLTETSIRETYIQALAKNSLPHIGSRKIRLVVDAGNGVGGLVGPELLRSLGADVIELYCEPDGTFPNHHPDPTVLENIVDLQKAVRDFKADAGIGWDGDADRIGVVDENGDVIYGDMLVLLYARAILTAMPGATIIGDVKCSSRLFDDVARLGGRPIMYKTGHSLMKGKLFEENAALAGEMSGHIFFNDRFYGFDDALYASARLLEILSNDERPLSSLLADLPHMHSTPEIRVDCPENIKFEIPGLLAEHFKGFPTDMTDGVRITFEHGWGLVRASNTQPVLVLRFEATEADLLKDYEHQVREVLLKVTPK
jgi:phosphomannomutase/phosphoglucomutase